MEFPENYNIIIRVRNGRPIIPSVDYWIEADKTVVPIIDAENHPCLYLYQGQWDAISLVLRNKYIEFPDALIDHVNETTIEEVLRITRDIMYWRVDATYNQRRTKTNMAGFIYVLQAGPYYKIGCSKNVDRRIEQLATLPPFDVELVHTMPTDNMKSTEQDLHRIFNAKRKNGEWFELDEEDVTWLKTL